MILDLMEFILRNYRNTVQWKVYQCTEVLAKGSTDKDELWDELRNAKMEPLTEKEMMERKEIEMQKQRARWNKLRKKTEASIKEFTIPYKCRFPSSKKKKTEKIEPVEIKETISCEIPLDELAKPRVKHI